MSVAGHAPAATGSVVVDGTRFAYLERGSGPLVLLLHGFPDTAHGFSLALDALAHAGYRAVAPFMRGYAPTEVPADGDYSVRRLGEDALGLARALGAERFFLVGHDWGAVAGYVAAGLAPYRVAGLVTAAVPHPRALRPHLAQLRRSWYMGFFQVRGVAERVVRARDLELVERLWRAWSPEWRFTADELAPVKRALAAPGGLEAALGYYRAMVAPAVLRDGGQRRAAFARTSVPTLTFAGTGDGCMGVELFERTAEAFKGTYELVRVEGAGHFMHRERPELFARRLIAFLDGLRATASRAG